MLWAFELKPKKDAKTGNPIMPDTNVETGFREGLTMVPHEFPCEFIVRSDARRKVMENDLDNARREIFPRYEQNELFMRIKK
jgi:hypothetical protein